MAKKLVVPSTITVYNPQGKPEPHTRANAGDLVRNAGYTWQKKVAVSPVAAAPYAINPNTKFTKTKAQEILDRATSKPEDDKSGGEAVDTVVDESVSPRTFHIPTAADDAAADAADEAAENEGETSAPPRARAPRQKKAPAPVVEEEAVESIEEE